jgi:hypothetical protein
MKDGALKLAAAMSMLISLTHLARFLFRWEIRIGGYEIPAWMSVAVFLIALVLAVFFWAAQEEK